MKAQAALAVADELLAAPVADRPNWTLPRLSVEIQQRTGVAISKSRLSVVLRKKRGLSYRRPRHTLKGRQDADAVERIGLRLALRKAQAEAGDLVLLHADESEALTHPYLARAWAKRGADLRVPAPGQSKKVAMLGARDAVTGELLVVASKTKRSADFVLLLEEMDRVYGPVPGVARKPVVIVLDNGPIHVSKATRKAIEARAHWLTVEWLPKYAPELSSWRDLKSHHLAHRTFADEAELEKAIHQAVAQMNNERATLPLGRQAGRELA